MKLTPQLDVFRHSPKAVAQAYRIAAESARRNPFETPDQGEARARYYEAEADRLELQQVAA
jgi:hypothetical protein